MARCWLLLVLISACAAEPELNETTQLSTSAQGTSAQGTSAQGTSAQGTSAQGTSAQGTTSGGTAVSGARVIGTALQFWKGNLQYTPTQICTWDSLHIVKLSCTTYDLTTQPSPLAGSRWPMTFTRKNSDGSKTYLHMHVQIGASATSVGAVRHDTTTAFFKLDQSNATGAVVGCSNPAGCRRNTDLFLYDVKVIDFNGTQGDLCPSGQRAMALAGTWDATATFHESSTQFTFACTNGTIAKCVRWGYRPWTSAKPPGAAATVESLAGFHQGCVRAAMADYCGTAHSFTKDGTIIDISDYDGFIPSARSLVTAQNKPYSATLHEALFDQLGGWWIDEARYEELQSLPPDPDTNYNYNIEAECPDRFLTGLWVDTYVREGMPTYPLFEIESAPACAHSELTIGKWLHQKCSACTGKVPAHCTDPTDPAGWTDECVQAAISGCTDSERMAAFHSECTAGAGLPQYASGCTLAMSLHGYASCFDTANLTAWTSTCVSAANTYCTGGREHSTLTGRYGFCNQLVVPILSL